MPAGLREAHEQNPGDAGLARELAWALLDADSAAAAVGVARDAVSVDDGHPEGYVVLASGLQRLGRWEEAFEALDEALRLEPENGLAHFHLGNGYYSQGLWTESEAHARIALEVQPTLVRANGVLAMALLNQRRVEEAEAVVDEALRDSPDDAYLHDVRAEIFRKTARPVEALAAFRRVAELEPVHVRAWVQIGTLEHILGNYPASVVAFERARDLDPARFAQSELEQAMLEGSRERRPYNR